MTTTALSRASLDAALDLTLTDEQWAAVRSEFAPAVIVAGAGSGKTTSMAARVAWLVGSGYVRPDQVLGLTFTTKATAQLLSSMRSSVSALVDAGIVDGETAEGDPIGEPQVLTYHAFSARILAEHGIRLGREPSPTMLTDGARQQLAYRVVCRSSLPLAGIGRSPLLVTKDLLSLDDELTELGVSPAALREFDDDMIGMLRSFEPLQRIGTEMAATSAQRTLLADLVTEWRAVKAERDVLDFADQIRLAGEIVHTFPDVVADLRARYAVVLLDEYQDTSIAQRVLLQRIFGEGHPVMAVGDPCQAIYGWRGASVDNIEDFPEHFPAGGDAAAARFTLSQNRRSGVSILEVANRTSAHLRTVHAGVEPLAAGVNGKGQGAVSCALFETYAQETEWVVGEIEATHSARGAGRAVSWSDIAVLAATGADLVAVDSALRRRGIPTQLVGAAALMAQPAVIDLRSMLELVHDPSANPAFVRLAVGPRWRIGARDLAALGDRAAQLAGGRHRSGQDDIGSALDDAVAGTDVVESISLTEALDDLGDLDRYSREAVERFQAMARELRDLRRHVGEPLPEFVLRVMRVTGLEVEAALGSPDAAAQQQHALHAFLDLTADFTELDGRLTLGAFLARLRDAERFDIDLELEVTGPADAVQLLTVHKAKGLEFAYVFVPFVASGAFPGGRGRSQWPTSASTVPWPLRDDCTSDLASFPVAGEGPRAKHYDEYRKVLAELSELESQRLAYVAFTRAEQGLAVSGHWWGPTQSTRRGPDGFLSTVHQACLDGFGEVVHWAPEPAEDAVNPQVQAASVPLAWPPAPDPERRSRLREVAAEVAAVPALQPALPGVDLPVPAAGGIGRRTCPHPGVGRAGVRPAGGGARASLPRAGGAPARLRVGEPAHAGDRRARGRGDGDRPAHAAPAGPGCPARHRVPRVGRDAVRAAVAPRPRRPARVGGRRHRDRRRPAGAEGGVRRRAVRAPRAGGRGGAVRAAGRRPGRQRADRRGVRGRAARHRLRRHRLEDGVLAPCRSHAARPVPAGLVAADGRARRAGVRGLRHRRHRRGPASGHRAGAGRPAGRLAHPQPA